MRPKRQFCQYLVIACKELWIFTFKVLMQKTYQLSLQFGCVIISNKWQKGLYFVICAPKCRFCQFLVVNCKKMWILTFKVSMQKLTNYPSSLGMQKWQKLTSYPSSSYLYVKFGRGIIGLAKVHHFPKVTKHDWILS